MPKGERHKVEWVENGVFHSLIPKRGNKFHHFVTKKGSPGVKGKELRLDEAMKLLVDLYLSPDCEMSEEIRALIAEIVHYDVREVFLSEVTTKPPVRHQTYSLSYYDRHEH